MFFLMGLFCVIVIFDKVGGKLLFKLLGRVRASDLIWVVEVILTRMQKLSDQGKIEKTYC